MGKEYKNIEQVKQINPDPASEDEYEKRRTSKLGKDNISLQSNRH
jgi:hypothetical protein